MDGQNHGVAIVLLHIVKLQYAKNRDLLMRGGKLEPRLCLTKMDDFRIKRMPQLSQTSTEVFVVGQDDPSTLQRLETV